MKIKEMVEHGKAGLYAAAAAGTMALGVVPAFASDTTTPGVAITTDMLQPVVTSTTANLAVIIPIGIGLFAILLGVGLVPRVIKMFTGSH